MEVSFDAAELAMRLKLTIEEAARDFRYGAFLREAERIGADKVALAHNMNDNAETVVMRLCRGAGVRGLRGIPAVRGIFVRPLIDTGRDEIEEHLESVCASYRTDSSNNTDEYLRNRVRRSVLPAMESAMGGNVARTLARASALAEEENSFMETVAEEAYGKCLLNETDREVALSSDLLLELHPAIISRVIRRALSKWSLKDMSREHVMMVRSLLGAQSGKSASLPGNLEARRDYGSIRLLSKAVSAQGFCYGISLGGFVWVPELKLHFSMELDGDVSYPGFKLVSRKALQFEKAASGLQIRSRKPGDRIRIRHVGSVKLKDYFINNKVSRERREHVGLLAKEGDVLWIMDEKGMANMDYEANGKAVFIAAWQKSD
jgi:tRNA(Ile)-lysidine synthase